MKLEARPSRMLFGDRNEFAVEFELDSESGDEWMFGRLCYWIDGHQVGDFDLGTSLRDVFFQMKYVFHQAGTRGGGPLCSLAPAEVFRLIDGALFEGDFRELSGLCNLISDDCGRFNVTPPVDVFDHWKVFLVECGESENLIYQSSESKVIESKRIPSGKFDQIVGAFRAELESHYNLLIGSD